MNQLHASYCALQTQGENGLNELVVAVLYALGIITLILNIPKPTFVDVLSKLISFFILFISFLFLY